MTVEQVSAAWQYPGSMNLSGGGGGGGNSLESEAKAYACAVTKDDFDKVTAYYQKKMGIRPQGIGGNAVVGEAIVRPGDGAHMILEDSLDRPMKLMVLNRHWQGKSVSVVITRANGESETHIAFSYYEKTPAAKP